MNKDHAICSIARVRLLIACNIGDARLAGSILRKHLLHENGMP